MMECLSNKCILFCWKFLIVLSIVAIYRHRSRLLRHTPQTFSWKIETVSQSHHVCGQYFPELRRDQIWMVETNGIQVLPPRIKCAIESILTKYPKHCLRFVFLVKERTKSYLIERELNQVRKNFASVNLRFEFIRSREILDQLKLTLKRPDFLRAKFYRNQMTDISRIWLVYKFGGVYFDSDIIVLQNRFQESIGDNFFMRSSDSQNNVNSAVLSFDRNHLLLRLVQKALRGVKTSNGYFDLLGVFISTVSKYCFNFCNVTIDSKVLNDMTKGTKSVFYQSSFFQGLVFIPNLPRIRAWHRNFPGQAPPPPLHNRN